MEAYINAHTTAPCDACRLPDLAQWLQVSGDLDDFIYYGEESYASER